MAKSQRLPVLFIGHGDPMNAIEDNEFSQKWRELGQSLPGPEAILSISAHWEAPGTEVTSSLKPRTIHDFYGFPRELNEKQYPAPGSPDLVERVKAVVKSIAVQDNLRWGFDHGTWSVLSRMYPDASIPVVQLSLHRGLDPETHFALGRELQSLRDEGVLILGSGNMVHNLPLARYGGGAYDWAVEYDASLKEWILERDFDEVVHYSRHGFPAELSVNSMEHYLPLLYVLGASQKDDPLEFFCDKVVMGSVSMRCVKLG